MPLPKIFRRTCDEGRPWCDNNFCSFVMTDLSRKGWRKRRWTKTKRRCAHLFIRHEKLTQRKTYFLTQLVHHRCRTVTGVTSSSFLLRPPAAISIPPQNPSFFPRPPVASLFIFESYKWQRKILFIQLNFTTSDLLDCKGCSRVMEKLWIIQMAAN